MKTQGSRVLLALSLLLIAAFVLTACEAPTPEVRIEKEIVEVEKTVIVEKEVEKLITPTPQPTLPPPPKYKEPTMLQADVDSGALPPVEERLPVTPKVVPVHESIGQYGGTWRLLGRPDADTGGFVRSFAYEALLRWTPDWKTIEPNIAESWEVNADATEFTFTLREGLKWSDGHPFTTEDIRFWYEDVATNKDLSPNPPGVLVSGGKTAKFELVDELTFKFIFEVPKGTFLMNLAAPDSLQVCAFPAHWAKQYHGDYNPDIAKLVEEANVQDWMELWNLRVSNGGYNFNTPGRPRMYAWWIPEGYPAYDGMSTQLELVRNPYYFKVDPEGNQLPYIDNLVFTLLESRDAMITKVLNGEVDMQWRHIAGPANKSLYFDHQFEGGFGFWKAGGTNTGEVSIHFNLVTEDVVLNPIFNNRDFRIALSYAVDRPSIIDAVMVGAGTAAQPAPRPSSLVYNEKLATQYTEFDLQKAKEHMEAGGFTQNAAGKWLGPDGQPISFVCEVSASTGYNAQSDMMNMISQQWQEFGVDMQIREIERSIFYERKLANLHECMVFAGESGEYFELLLQPRLYVPTTHEAIWGVGWYLWHQSPEDYPQYEPPPVIKELFDIYYNDVVGTADSDVQFEAMTKILEIAQENFWQIGVAYGPDDYGIVKNNFHNVPDMPLAWEYPTFAPGNPEQFYFDPLP